MIKMKTLRHGTRDNVSNAGKKTMDLDNMSLISKYSRNLSLKDHEKLRNDTHSDNQSQLHRSIRETKTPRSKTVVSLSNNLLKSFH